MPKMTRKYSLALSTYHYRVGGDKRAVDVNNQEALYAELSRLGYLWDSTQSAWIELAAEPADEPTPLVMVRVWADGDIVEEAADLVSDHFKRKGFAALKRSEPYRCRPPKQLESRIYLEFIPPAKGAK